MIPPTGKHAGTIPALGTNASGMSGAVERWRTHDRAHQDPRRPHGRAVQVPDDRQNARDGMIAYLDHTGMLQITDRDLND